MDIKPGRVTWPPEADKEKIAHCSAKKPGTKIPFGFGFSGMVVNTDQGTKKLAKPFGQALDATTVHTILENYLGDKNGGCHGTKGGIILRMGTQGWWRGWGVGQKVGQKVR